MAAIIRQFLIRQDNFAVLIHDPATGATASIDATEAAPIMAALDEEGWTLTHILVTHEHHDHVEGVPALKERYGARVVAPARSTAVPGVDVRVREGDVVEVGQLTATVIDTPGHCADHIAYHFADENVAFVGDTLFAMGAGRMFSGPAATFWESLCKLKALPDETIVYCGHEYTLANARFALAAEPGNGAISRRATEVELKRAKGEVTLPTTIGLEKATNPFLRADLPAVAREVGKEGADPAEVFGALRAWKNTF
jgi:hydroxyacylglutathione hydrolase